MPGRLVRAPFAVVYRVRLCALVRAPRPWPPPPRGNLPERRVRTNESAVCELGNEACNGAARIGGRMLQWMQGTPCRRLHRRILSILGSAVTMRIAAVADDLLPRLRSDPRLHTPANEGQTNRSVWEPNSNTHPDWLAERRGFELSVRERTDDDGFLKPRARDGFFNQNLRKSA